MLMPSLLRSQPKWFVGAVGGITTLSADAKSVLSPERSEISSYKPENGPTYWLFGGRHWNDYLSVQLSYSWNRNLVKLTSARNVGSDFTYYEQTHRPVQHAIIGEVLLYFRDRGSFARPYLTVGTGAVYTSSSRGNISQTSGVLSAPGAFSSTDAGLRVAVGIDMRIKDGWAFRYSFSETMQHNPFSRQLTPQADRRLASFQNLFGIIRQF